MAFAKERGITDKLKQYRPNKYRWDWNAPSKESLEAQKADIHRTTMRRLRKYKKEKQEVFYYFLFA